MAVAELESHQSLGEGPMDSLIWMLTCDRKCCEGINSSCLSHQAVGLCEGGPYQAVVLNLSAETTC